MAESGQSSALVPTGNGNGNGNGNGLTKILVVDNNHFSDLPSFFHALSIYAPEVRLEILENVGQRITEVSQGMDQVCEAFLEHLNRDYEVRGLTDKDDEVWNTIKNNAIRATTTRNNKEEATRSLRELWGRDTLEREFACLMNAGSTAWARLRKISRADPNRSIYDIKNLLNRAILERLTNPHSGISRNPLLMSTDLQKVAEKTVTTPVTRAELLASGYDIGTNGWIVKINTDRLIEEEVDGEDGGEEDVPDSATQASPAKVNSELTLSGQSGRVETRAQRKLREAQEQLLTGEGGEDTLDEELADVRDAAVAGAAPPDDGEDDTAASRPAKKRKRNAHDDEEGDGHDKGCKCEASIPKALLQELDKKSQKYAKEGLEQNSLVKRWFKHSTKTWCFHHLKILGGLVGFQTKRLNADALKTRLESFHERAIDGTLGAWKTDKDTYHYFRVNARPARAEDGLGPYSWAPRPISTVKMNADELTDLRRYLHVDYSLWDKDGTVVLDCFDWWKTMKYTGTKKVSFTSVFDVVIEEFDMYKHHLREINGKPNYGWLRNMFHGLGQQAMRQDPVYYAMYVALRPDASTNLIAYPYYAKYQTEGDSTFFRHIDINIKNMVLVSRGANMIQGSVSLDDELEDDCTEIIPGMHKHSKEWEERLISRGLTSDGLVQKITEMHWIAEDATHFKTDWTAQPCKSTQVRISSPRLPHGAKGPAKRVRRTMLPWFVSLQDDFESLEVTDSGTFSDLSRAHRDLDAAANSPSGLANRYGVIQQAFGAAVALNGLGPLSDSLVGRSRHNMASVIAEKKMFLTGSDEERNEYLVNWRRTCVNLICELFEVVIATERARFGTKSYFIKKDAGTLHIKPDPDAVPEPDSSSDTETRPHGHEEDSEDEESVDASQDETTVVDEDMPMMSGALHGDDDMEMEE